MPVSVVAAFLVLIGHRWTLLKISVQYGLYALCLLMFLCGLFEITQASVLVKPGADYNCLDIVFTTGRRIQSSSIYLCLIEMKQNFAD